LPSKRVLQTPEVRNWVYMVSDMKIDGVPYHVFFAVSKKGSKRNKFVDLRVESAYYKFKNPYGPSRRLRSMKFPNLIQNTFLGR